MASYSPAANEKPLCLTSWCGRMQTASVESLQVGGGMLKHSSSDSPLRGKDFLQLEEFTSDVCPAPAC